MLPLPGFYIFGTDKKWPIMFCDLGSVLKPSIPLQCCQPVRAELSANGPGAIMTHASSRQPDASETGKPRIISKKTLIQVSSPTLLPRR
jgi:hypothetical protein